MFFLWIWWETRLDMQKQLKKAFLNGDFWTDFPMYVPPISPKWRFFAFYPCCRAPKMRFSPKWDRGGSSNEFKGFFWPLFGILANLGYSLAPNRTRAFFGPPWGAVRNLRDFTKRPCFFGCFSWKPVWICKKGLFFDELPLKWLF